MEHSYVYSLPYIVLVLCYGGMSILYHANEDELVRQRIRWACLGLFLFFFGFRGLVGDDWTNYYPMYERISAHNLQDMIYAMQDTAYEPAFFFLTLFCKLISNESYVFYTFVCCSLNLWLLYRFLRRYVENIPLGFTLFLCMGGFVMSTNLMRNSISILIFVNSIPYLIERKPLPYFSLAFLGVCFHYSSLLYFPLYFFFHKRCPRWLFIVILVVGNLIFLLNIRYLTPILLAIAARFGEVYETILQSYIEGKYADISMGISIGYLERLLTSILVLCYYDKLCQLRKENALFINCLVVYFILTFYFYEFQIIGQRLANLFVCFYWVIWADLINCFSITNNKLLYLGFVSMYSVLKIAGLTSLETLQYDNYLFGAKTYEERLYIHLKYQDDDDIL